MGIINYIKELENIGRDGTTPDTNNNSNNDGQSNLKNKDNKDDAGLLRFELKSMAPEATRIPSYPTGPIFHTIKIEDYVKYIFGKKKFLI